MNAVIGFIVLMSLIAKCYPAALLTEFDIEFKKIEDMLKKSEKMCPNDCQNFTDPECQCVYLPTNKTTCTDDQYIEHGLRKLNFVCIPTDNTTHKTCRMLARLKDDVKSSTTLCAMPMAQKDFLEHVKMVSQKQKSHP